jgi:hypothetical protein
MENSSAKDWVLPDAYRKQRRDRMADLVFDYLVDEETTSREVYEEMLSEVQSCIDYHKKFLNKAQGFYELMLGNRPVTLDFE